MSGVVFVSVAEDPALSVLGEQLDLLAGDSKQNFAQLGAKGQVKAVLDDGFFKNVNKVFAGSEEDIDTTVSLVLSVLSPADLKAYAPRLITALSSKPEEQSAIKLQKLAELYGMFVSQEQGSAAFSVMSALLKFAVASNQAAAVAPNLNLDSIVTDCKLKGNEESELYRLSAEVFKSAQKPSQHSSTMFKYLRSISDASSDTEKKLAVGVAVEAIGNVLNSESLLDLEALLDLPLVQKLQNDKQHAKLYQLLHIFAVENVDAYNKFYSENKEFVASLGLNHEEAVQKLRSLTLCSMSVEKDCLSFSDVQQALQLSSEEEVEQAVVDAVASGRLEARIDQQKQIIIVQRADARSFQKESWLQLSDKLRSWQNNVQHVLANLHSVQMRARPDAMLGEEDE